jgi:PAS domain S-box-containing protein
VGGVVFLLVAAAVSVVAHVTRLRTLIGIDELRLADAQTRERLEEALAQARAARQAAEASERKARAIVNTAPDGIITINSSGVIESFNTAAEPIFRYASEEIVGQHVGTLLPSLARGRLHGSSVGDQLLVGRRKDGTAFSVELTISQAKIGKRWTATIIVRDIRERRRAEAKATAETVSRAKADFQVTMSHEMRKPTTDVIGMTELLLAGPLAPEQHERVAAVRSAAQRLLGIIERLAAPVQPANPALEAPPAEVRGGPVVDRDETQRRLGGNVELLRRVIQKFVDGHPQLLGDVRTAIERGDAHGLHHAAHSLKSTVAVFGAQAARDMALALEQQGRAGEVAGAEMVFAMLEEQVGSLVAELRKWNP